MTDTDDDTAHAAGAAPRDVQWHLIAVDLHIDGTWAVGGLGRITEGADLPLAGKPGMAFIPATGLVGSLRRHLDATAGSGATWLGPAHGDRGHTSKTASSPLRVLGVLMPDPGTVRTLATTAIDEWSRAAKPGSLRQAEQVDPGASRPLARWFILADRSVDRPITELVAALRTWSPWIGRGRSYGQGRASVHSIHHVTVQPYGRHLTWWLGGRDSWFAAPPGAVPVGPDGVLVHTDDGSALPPTSLVAATFTITHPVHVGSSDATPTRAREATTRTVDVAPMHTDSDGRVVIPGTAWKGLFRHRVRFILTTLRDAGELRDDVDIDAVLARLFGGQDRRGILRFTSSLVTVSNRKAATPENPKTQDRKHVAIDRISGGAARSKLFGKQHVRTGTFTVRIDVEVGGVEPADIALLRHVVRDLHDGLIGIGGSTTRGYGSVTLTAPDALGPLGLDDLLQPAAPEGPTQ